MERKIITLPGEHAPAPVSPAAKAGGFIFCSGQCGYDMEKGCFYGEDIETQTRGALRNLQATLEAAGSDLEHVLKVNIYLADVNDFPTVNAIYKEFFSGEMPARSCLQIARIPLDARIEIEAVAIEK